MFYSAHPNIFQFIQVLKNIQSDIYIKMRSSEEKRRNYIISKEDFEKEKLTEKYWEKLIATNLLNLFLINYLLNLN